MTKKDNQKIPKQTLFIKNPKHLIFVYILQHFYIRNFNKGIFCTIYKFQIFWNAYTFKASGNVYCQIIDYSDCFSEYLLIIIKIFFKRVIQNCSQFQVINWYLKALPSENSAYREKFNLSTPPWQMKDDRFLIFEP